MKVRIGRSKLVKDVKSAKGNLHALRKISERQSRKELSQLKSAKVLPRSLSAASNTKVTLKLNASGNLRGMHNAENPPDSEHMRRIRGMRRFYNKQMPQLQCSACAFSSSCPQFKAGYVCAFLPFLNSHKVESTRDLVDYMKELCGSSMRRAHLMTLMETLSGAPPSLETSEALGIAFEQLNKLHQTMTASGVSEVSIESNDGGIIGKLFGSLNTLVESTKHANQNPIDVSPVRTMIADREDSPILENSSSVVDFDLVREHSKEELEHSVGKKMSKSSIVSISELKK